MTKHQLSKTAAALLAATLVFGGTAWAETAPNTAPASTSSNAQAPALKRFPDVAANHWATKHITKLALLGIVEGNEKGQYQPESKVTQEQVITMAVRMMGLEAEAKALPAFYSELEVSEYAKPYLHMALEKGLIDWQEEKTLSGTAKWGAKNATREWVAKLTVRAIGKREEAQKLATQDSAFTDNSSISIWAKGYINEAVALKIVNGMEDGSFKPQDTVTRAQMATFLSRAGQYTAVTGGNTAVGVVDSVSGDKLTLVTDMGDKATYSFQTVDSVVYGLANDTPIGVSDLKANNKVYVIHSNGKAVYAEVLEEQAKDSNTLEGKLVRVDMAETSAKLTLQTANGESTVELAAPPTIVDLEGRGLKLSDLVPGATLELHRSGSRAKYSNVIVKHIPVNKTAEGVIQFIDMNARTLSVLEKETGTVQFALAETVTYLNGGAAGDLNTLRNGDTIRYRVTNDYVTHIDMIAAYVEPSDSGKMLSIGTQKDITYITIQKDDNQLASYAVDDMASVEIPGLTFASTKDLLTGDAVKVMLTDKNKVTKIIVSNRSMATEFLNTVVNYDAESKALTVQNADGALKAYRISDETKLINNGATVALSTASNLLTKGRKLDITASSDAQVKTIRIVTGYEGIVARVDPERSEITLKMGNSLQTLKVMQGASIELSGRTTNKLGELATGIKVKLMYEPSMNSIVRIQALSTVTYRLTGKTSSQLTMKDDSGNIVTLNIPYDARLYNQSQVEVAVTDLPLDEPYEVEHSGTNVDKVRMILLARGSITAVNNITGTISYVDAGSSTVKTVTVGSGVKVKRDGTTAYTTGLAGLKAGDRVEISKDSSGNYSITVAQQLSKSLDYYENPTQTLYVLRENVNENRTYSLHPKIYIHKGSMAITLANLVRNDKINLYLIDGKIIELDKQ